VKKGRHRRFEEARDLKRALKIDEPEGEPCPECGASPGRAHASWCLATEDDDYEEAESPNGFSPAAAEPKEAPGAGRPPEP
jgi:hypothetical protein